MRVEWRWAVAACWAAAVTSVAAQTLPSTERLAACAACHGTNGNAQIPNFPSLAGQPKLFIENQLVLIREGLREVPAMQAVMQGMSDAEITALASHFAAQTPATMPAASDAAKAKLGQQLSQRLLCGTCHLAAYQGQQQVPRLAGQREDYLLLSMKQFRDNPGPGRDTIMASTLRGLSDADLAALAHYLAPFKP